MNLPTFKYIENPEKILAYSDKPINCDCCGKEVHCYANSMYTQHQVNAICCDCIKDGSACKKFKGNFNDAIEMDNASAMEELLTRTPPLPTYQNFFWPECCEDFCKFLRVCSPSDLKDEKILSDLKETYDEEEVSFEELSLINPYYILLFQCLKCGKHHIIIDFD